MKLLSYLRLTVIASLLTLTSQLHAHGSHTADANPTTDTPNPKNLTNDQQDPTDALAIPLDSSETEQQAEIKTLEDESKKAPQAAQPK